MVRRESTYKKRDMERFIYCPLSTRNELYSSSQDIRSQPVRQTDRRRWTERQGKEGTWMPIGESAYLKCTCWAMEKRGATEWVGTRMLSGLKDKRVASFQVWNWNFYIGKGDLSISCFPFTFQFTHRWICGGREQGKVNLSTNCIRTSRGVFKPIPVSR